MNDSTIKLTKLFITVHKTSYYCSRAMDVVEVIKNTSSLSCTTLKSMIWTNKTRNLKKKG